MSEKLIMFISLNPEAAYPLFKQIAVRDFNNLLELLLNCPEKQVRSCASQLLRHIVNVVISHHNLDLTKPVNNINLKRFLMLFRLTNPLKVKKTVSRKLNNL